MRDADRNFVSKASDRIPHDRKWVERCLRDDKQKVLLKHLLAHHSDPDHPPCECGMSAQEIVDRMDWSRPSGNKFHYQTDYREYPRLIKAAPHLDHSRYARMIASYRTVPEVLSFFASHPGARLISLEELESVLGKRFGGSLWNDPAMRSWVTERTGSSRTLMYRRWKACPMLEPIVAALEAAEVMLA